MHDVAAVTALVAAGQTDERGQDQRDHQHAEQLDEDGADRGHGFGQPAEAEAPGQETQHDAGPEAGQDLGPERESGARRSGRRCG